MLTTNTDSGTMSRSEQKSISIRPAVRGSDELRPICQLVDNLGVDREALLQSGNVQLATQEVRGV
jgi:hypothetical protein